MADGDADMLADARKLPLVERVAHKNWKARSEAWEDVRASCARVFSTDDPVLARHGACHCPACQRLVLGAALQPDHAAVSLSMPRFRSSAGLLSLAQASNLPAAVLFPKAMADANAAALDKALEALAAWLLKADETQAAR